MTASKKNHGVNLPSQEVGSGKCLTLLAVGIALLAHAAGKGAEQICVGANAADIDLLAASIVGHAVLRAGGQTRDTAALSEGGRREEGEGGEGVAGEHGSRCVGVCVESGSTDTEDSRMSGWCRS